MTLIDLNSDYDIHFNIFHVFKKPFTIFAKAASQNINEQCSPSCRNQSVDLQCVSCSWFKCLTTSWIVLLAVLQLLTLASYVLLLYTISSFNFLLWLEQLYADLCTTASRRFPNHTWIKHQREMKRDNFTQSLIHYIKFAVTITY